VIDQLGHEPGQMIVRQPLVQTQTSGTWVKITFEVESGCVDLVGGGAAVAGA